jgi:signal transduction histidine kinase
MTGHSGRGVRRVSLRSTMTRPPRTAPRPEHTPARGIRAGRDRLLAASRRYPLLTDAAVAAVVLAISVLPVFTAGGGIDGPALALTIAAAVLLVFRRQHPVGVFWLIFVLAVASLFTLSPWAIDPVLVAFYTLAEYERPRRVLCAGVTLAAFWVLSAVATGHVRDSLQVWGGILSLSAWFAAAGFAGYYVRTRRAYLEAVEDRAGRAERERDQQAQLAAAAERVKIAREVHDIVAHNIAVMIALADGAAYTAEASPGQAASVMDQVSATGRSALGEMRRLVGVLREPAKPGHAPQPGLDDIHELAATMRAAGLPARLTVTGPPVPLPPGAQLALYRITQEALTNTLKHAPGATAQVRLAYRPGQVELEVTDDGRPDGVPAGGEPADPRGGGHGIAGMRERAGTFGGQVSAGPRPGGGWRVRTVLRLAPAPPGDQGAARADGTLAGTAAEDG